MILNSPDLIKIAESVNSQSRKARRAKDYKRFLLYHGNSIGIIQEALAKEFTPATVADLINRIVSLNITKKIVNKLAGVYTEPPTRKVSDDSKTDTELLNKYEDTLKLNTSMKEANRYFKLTKRLMLEIFLGDDGKPGTRALPAHTYEVYSYSKKNPNRVDVVVIIQEDSVDLKDQRLEIWSDESYYLVNGLGAVIIQGNEYETPREERNINPYKKLPFFYKCENSLSVDPIEDDDLMQMAIVIPVVLTDLLFGLKYQTFSLLYSVGVKGDIALNPNTIVSLEYDADGNAPKIEAVKAVFDSDKILNVVYNLIEMLLSVNNLSSPVTRGSVSGGNAVSGISKILDSAEPIENKRDQQEYFLEVENDVWSFISKIGIPVWKKTRNINSEFIKEFSSAFIPTIQYKEPKALISDKEKVETLKGKRELKAITRKDVVRELNPDLSDETLDSYIKEIDEEAPVVKDEIPGRGEGDRGEGEGDE